MRMELKCKVMTKIPGQCLPSGRIEYFLVDKMAFYAMENFVSQTSEATSSNQIGKLVLK